MGPSEASERVSAERALNEGDYDQKLQREPIENVFEALKKFFDVEKTLQR